MISINKQTMKVVRDIIGNADYLGCKVIKMDCGATLIDMGLHYPGGWKAAELFTRVTIADMGIVQYGTFKLNDDYTLTSVEVLMDEPSIAAIGSQIAGWKLGEGEYATIGTGPARSLAVHESDHYFEMTSYRDNHDEAILCLQDVKYPTDEKAIEIAEACKVKPENLYLLISDSTCLTASVQVSARMTEQTCHKMFEKGFDIRKIVRLRGRAPIAPICKDETKTMGRINDALIYGSEVEVWVDATDIEIQRVIHQLVAKTSSPNFGELFEDVFVAAGKDFYYIEQDVHSVGKITIHNVNSGRAFVAGEISYDLLEKSFLR